jgi:hypothetical protein
MELVVFLLPIVILVMVATTRGPVAVTGPPNTKFGLAVTGRLTVVVQTIENFWFTIVKLPEEK